MNINEPPLCYKVSGESSVFACYFLPTHEAWRECFCAEMYWLGVFQKSNKGDSTFWRSLSCFFNCKDDKYKLVSQSCAVAKSEKSWHATGQLNCQTEWKTAPLAKVQLCEHENQTLKFFFAASRLYAKFNCPVARQNVSPITTAHDCETGIFIVGCRT